MTAQASENQIEPLDDVLSATEVYIDAVCPDPAPMPSIERPPLNEVSSNPKSSAKRPHSETSSAEEKEKKEKEKLINRKTLHELQSAAELSPEKMDNLKASLFNVDECDNKRLRYKVREWITMNVPHNKQDKVREEIFDTLYALVPHSTQSMMANQEMAYRTGSMEPPGYLHTCPSDDGSDDEPQQTRENSDGSDNNGSHDTGDANAPTAKKRKTSNTKPKFDETIDETIDTSDDRFDVSTIKLIVPKGVLSSPKADVEENIDDKFDVSSIHLEGEENDAVPVFETCDMIRRKIEDHLEIPGVTQASFCRDLHSQFHTDAAPKRIDSKYLSRFREKVGYDRGNTSAVFYAAYCFFEKLRIKEGEPKSEDRLKMEELWADKGGFDTKRMGHTKHVKCHNSMRPMVNQYGEASLKKSDGSVVRNLGVM